MNFMQRAGAIILISTIVLLYMGCRSDEKAQPSPYAYAADQSAEVSQAWMGLLIEMDRYTKGYRPAPIARALAYMNLAAYEACMKGMPSYKSLSHLYPDLEIPAALEGKDYHWPTVVNAVYATLFEHFFPSDAFLDGHADTYLFKMVELAQDFDDTFREQVGGEIFKRSSDHGKAVAEAFWEWSKSDPFGHNAYLNPSPSTYEPPVGPGLWAPTPPDYRPARFPNWGKVRTFAIQSQQKVAPPPLTFSQQATSPFYAQALAVRNAVLNLKFSEQWVAEFWSDDFEGVTFSPAVRWISITHQVLEKENANLELALYTYAKVSLALHDAVVACWHSKYLYNVERPVSYIQRVIQNDWLPHWDKTPAFPAYPSGHSTMGAAAAEVLSHIFGYDYAMTDNSHADRQDFYGMPRSFASFYDMAFENAYSRLYLGVHFQMDCDAGLEMGFAVGRKINDMPFK